MLGLGLLVVISAPPPPFVMTVRSTIVVNVRSTIVVNVLTPTLEGTILFVNHILGDISCCSILIFRLMQRAL